MAKVPDVRSKRTITKFEVTVRNAGSSIVKKANFRIKVDQATLVYHEIIEKPAKLITHSDEIDDANGEITVSEFTLEPSHSIKCVFFTESARKPEIAFEGSSTEDVVTWSTGSSLSYGVDDHLLSIFKLWIFASFVTPLITGVAITLGTLAQGLGVFASVGSGPLIGAAQILGSVFSLYFYLKMIPHVLIVLEAFEGRFFRPTPRRP